MAGQKPDTLSIRLNTIALHVNLYLHIPKKKRSSGTVHISFPSTSYVVIHPYLYKNE